MKASGTKNRIGAAIIVWSVLFIVSSGAVIVGAQYSTGRDDQTAARIATTVIDISVDDTI